MLVNGAVPRSGSISYSRLDHNLPAVLNLLPIEKEVFYIIHFACYAMGKKCKEEIIKQSDSLALNSILKIDTREETAAALKEMICSKVNCTIQNDPNWMNCSQCAKSVRIARAQCRFHFLINDSRN